jgi:lipopolysaccharide transport system permease protein
LQKQNDLKTTVYSSDKQTHFFKELREILKDLKSSQFLAIQMTKRDLKAEYRQSVLGFFWAFAPILMNSLVWIFLNSSGVVKVAGAQSIPYIPFVVVGTTLWSIFTDCLLLPLSAVNNNKSILSKINFPKEALILSGLYKMGFNLALKLILVIGILVAFKITPTIDVLLFPVYLITITLFALAIGLLVTPLGLIYTDIGRIIGTGVSLLMYITPVVYAAPTVGIFKKLFAVNPLTYLFTDAKASLFGLPLENISFMVITLVSSLIVIFIGLVIFRKAMPIIIEKISG